MIHFPPLRTPRLDVQLRELTMQQAVQLAAIPPTKHEAAVAALLAFVVAEAKGPHAEPGRWTVQERMLVVAHYLSAVSDEGGNFSIGEGRFLDYLYPAMDTAPAEIQAGAACGHDWVLRQLTGDEALALESHCSTRLQWLAGDMAARLRPAAGYTDPVPDASTSAHAYGEWLASTMADTLAMPESDFAELFALYRHGLRELHHLFALDFDAAGHIVLAKTKEGGGQQLAPARFPVSACIADLAHILGE